MAVYGWIYANAKIRGDGGHYLVRRCDSGLKGYEDMLTSLSRAMLATTKRYGQAEGQECWLFGFLDKGRHCPVVAVAGEQERLLGMSLAGGGFRKQYCVLAWGVEGESIPLCKRVDEIFEPLKEIMRGIQRTGKTEEPGKWKEGAAGSVLFGNAGLSEKGFVTQDSIAGIGAHEPYNIVRSGLEDGELWEKSLCRKPPRPIMTGCLGVEEAKRMLGFFPDGLVTVAGDIKPQYYDGRKEKGIREAKIGNGGRSVNAERRSGAESFRKEQRGKGAGTEKKDGTGEKDSEGEEGSRGKTAGTGKKDGIGKRDGIEKGYRIGKEYGIEKGDGIEKRYGIGKEDGVEKRYGIGKEDGTGRVCVASGGVVIMSEGWHGTEDSKAGLPVHRQETESGRGGKTADGQNAGNGGRAAVGRVAAGRQQEAGSRNTAGGREKIKDGKAVSRKELRKEERKQALEKEREEEERKKIITCAKMCREALDKRLVEDILDAVGRMGLKDGFSQQMRFFGCMYLWRSIYLGQNAMKGRKEISYFLEAWRREVKNKNGAFQANKIMADEVMKLIR